MLRKSFVVILVCLFFASASAALAIELTPSIQPAKASIAPVASKFLPTSQPIRMQLAAAKTDSKKGKEAARPDANLQLLSMTLGGSAYVMSFALAEIVNKNHPWLRLTAVETKGSVANLVTMAREPGLRKNTLFFTHEESNSWAREGRPPFKTPYKGARAVASMAETTLVFATLDRNIKSKADADGKRIMTMQKGTSTAVIHEMLFDIWGIKPRMSYGDFNTIKDGLSDGIIDIGTQPINGIPGIGYSPIPALQELMTTKNVYFLNVSAADVNAVVKKGGFDIYAHTIPARAIGDKQPEPVTGYSHSLSWWADVEMSDETVYEITKAIYDNAEKFKEYHRDGRMITKKTLARIGVADELFHPGALKFYKEKGIKPGVH